MSTMRITICGAGTLGGNLAENLARMGMAVLSVIDHDIVEGDNTANQPYSSSHVGKPKTKALAEVLYLAVGAKVSGINKKLTAANANALLANSDIVIDAFDNHNSRKIVSKACEEAGLPCLHCGLGADGYGEVIWNERYKVPSDGENDPCGNRRNRNMSLLVVAAATNAIMAFQNEGTKGSYTVTLKDLAILPY